MARILALSSQVARGTVGLSIIVPALQALGHEVIALPTVVLSNHPGHAHVAGSRIEPPVLHAMLDALEANGWLAGVDAVLTGYLPSVAHVEFAVATVGRMRALTAGRPFTFLCDPVLGDDPKGLYIDEAAANAIRARLIPLADIATPNRFELSFLASKDGPFNVTSAAMAARTKHRRGVTFATSIPSNDAGAVINIMTTQDEQAYTKVRRRTDVPNGTGDLFSALILSKWLNIERRRAMGEMVQTSEALAFATRGVDRVLSASFSPGCLSLQALPRVGDPRLNWPVHPTDGLFGGQVEVYVGDETVICKFPPFEADLL